MNKIITVKKINIFSDPKDSIDFHKFKKLDLIKNKNIKKILIIKWGAMGDVIQSTAVINDILNSFKNSMIDLNTLPAMEVFFVKDKRINKIWSISFGKQLNKYIKYFLWLKRVKKENYDLIIDLQTNDKSRILLSILRLFFSYPKFSIGNHFVYPYSIKSKFNSNFINPFFLLKRTIETIGVKSTSNIPHIVYDKKNAGFLKNKKINKNFIIFIPGSSKENKLKRWGIKNFKELANKLIEKKFQIILIGGPDDINDCHEIGKSNVKIQNLCNTLELSELIPLFSKAKLIIANDTGPTHLASCTTTPIIQITGPTNPLKVKPFGKKIISIQSDIECKNCYQKKCGHHSCMKGIEPKFILQLAKKLI
jgi:heptosyltransferase-2